MDTLRENTTTITPGLFYRYVFEGIKTDSRSSEIQIQTKKARNRAYFKFLDTNPLLSQNFRAVLRQLQAASLEDALFGNHEDPVEPASAAYQFPDKTVIDSEFDKRNARYGFFLNQDQDLAKTRFMMFFSAAKLIADYIECNNDPENDLPFLNAWKMAVTSEYSKGDAFASIHNLMKTVQSQKPLHDVLLLDLPDNNPPLQDMQGWRLFIKKYGFRGLEIFQMASGIEGKTAGKAPPDMIEARKIISQITYRRYEENPELALICKHYKLHEHLFNRCLEVDKTRKSQDRLPETFVDGRDAGYPGYFLVKLPLHDPRQYVLGHITNCCQSIGGHAERCAIDLARLETSAAYVLLKGKEQQSPMINGKINYRHFQIVGQAYAWLSTNNHLVLDSWENLRPETDDAVITAILPAFGKQVTAQSPEIFKVLIGRGGKTPRALSRQSTKAPKTMIEGYQYADSTSQSLLYLDEAKWDAVLKPLYEKWDALTIKPKISRRAFFSFLSPRPLIDDKLQADIEKYCLCDSFFESCHMSGIFESGWENWQFNHFFSFAKMLDAKKIFTPEFCRFLLRKSVQEYAGIKKILNFLEEHNLLTREMLAAFTKSPERDNSGAGLNDRSSDLKKCHEGLTHLKRKNILTPENCRIFIQSFESRQTTETLIGVLIFLRKFNLITAENSHGIHELFYKSTGYHFLEDLLQDLLANHCLTGQTFTRLLLLSSRIPLHYATTLLKTFHQLQLPLNDYFDEVLKHPNLHYIYTYLLMHSSDLSREILKRLLRLDGKHNADSFKHAATIIRAFVQLQLPQDEYFDKILKNRYLYVIADYVGTYSSDLTQEIFEKVCFFTTKTDVGTKIQILRTFIQLQLPLDDYFNTVLAHPNVKDIAAYLKKYSSDLNREIFMRLVALVNMIDFKPKISILRAFVQLQLPLDDHFDKVLQQPNVKAIDSYLSQYSADLTREIFQRLLLLGEHINARLARTLFNAFRRLQLLLDDRFDKVLNHRDLYAVAAYCEHYSDALPPQNTFIDEDRRTALSRFAERCPEGFIWILPRPDNAEFIAAFMTTLHSEENARLRETSSVLLIDIYAWLLTLPAGVFNSMQFIQELCKALLSHPANLELMQALIKMKRSYLTESNCRKLLGIPEASSLLHEWIEQAADKKQSGLLFKKLLAETEALTRSLNTIPVDKRLAFLSNPELEFSRAMDNPCGLIQCLQKIPADERRIFIENSQEDLKNLLEHISKLVHILKEGIPDKALPFPDSAVLEKIRIFEKADTLISILHTIANHEIQDFVNQSPLNLPDFPVEKLKKFLDTCFGKLGVTTRSILRNRTELAWVLPKIPYCLWGVFLTSLNPDINALIPSPCEFSFYERYIPKNAFGIFMEISGLNPEMLLKPGAYSLYTVLRWYPGDARLAFLTRQKLDVSTSGELINILSTLSTADCREFLRRNPPNLQNSIQTSDQLFTTVLNRLDQNLWKDFLTGAGLDINHFIKSAFELKRLSGESPSCPRHILESIGLDSKIIDEYEKPLTMTPHARNSLFQSQAESRAEKPPVENPEDLVEMNTNFSGQEFSG